MAEPDFEVQGQDEDDFTPDEPAREAAPAPPSEREHCLEVVRRVLLGEPRPHSLEAAVVAIEKELAG
jgi:hypothetical protein